MTSEFTLRRPLFATVLAITLSACGGGDSDAGTPAPAAVAGFNTTASLKTTNTVLYTGKNYGQSRAAIQGLVDQCNSYRQLYYRLGAVTPSESTLASADVFVYEKSISTDKALTLVTGTNLVLSDFRRWQDQLPAAAAAGGYPAVPPDCSITTANASKRGTLWRDGLMYDLRFDTSKAIGSKVSTVPVAYAGSDRFTTFPLVNQSGQTCREVSGVTDLSPDSHACVWDIFPYVKYLNWPFALSGRVQFGPDPTLFETIVTQTAERGKALDPTIFDIPAGFTVTVLN